MQRFALFLFAMITITVLMPTMATSGGGGYYGPQLRSYLGWQFIVNRPDLKFRMSKMSSVSVKGFQKDSFYLRAKNTFNQNKDFMAFNVHLKECKENERVEILSHHFRRDEILYFTVLCDEHVAKQYLISLNAFSKRNILVHHELYRYMLHAVVVVDALRGSETSQNTRLEKALYWLYINLMPSAFYAQQRLLPHLSKRMQSQTAFKHYCRASSTRINPYLKRAAESLKKVVNSLQMISSEMSIKNSSMYYLFRIHISNLITGLNTRLLRGDIPFNEGEIVECPDRSALPTLPKKKTRRKNNLIFSRAGVQFSIYLMHEFGFVTPNLNRHLERLERYGKNLQPRKPSNDDGKSPPILNLSQTQDLNLSTKDVKHNKKLIAAIEKMEKIGLTFEDLDRIFGNRKNRLSTFWFIVIIFLPLILSLIIFWLPNPIWSIKLKKILYSLSILYCIGTTWSAYEIWDLLDNIYAYKILCFVAIQIVLIVTFFIKTGPGKKEQTPTKQTKTPLDELKSLIKDIERKKDYWEVLDDDNQWMIEHYRKVNDNELALEGLNLLEFVFKKLVAYENDLKQEMANQRKADIHRANLQAASLSQVITKATETNEEIVESIAALLRQSKDLKWVEQMNERLFAVLAIENGEGRKALKALRYDIQQNPPEK